MLAMNSLSFVRCVKYVTFLTVCLTTNISAKEISHQNAVSGCAHCHGATAAKEPVALKGCDKCHAQPDSSFLLKVADKTSAVEPVKGAAGMSLPMYYAQTRVGTAPNAMIAIPAGEFLRDSDVRLADEGPQHSMHLPSFSIDKYEVTNLQYKQFIDATNRRSPEHFRNRTFPEGKADHPVTYVSWFDAKVYCEWAAKRLPTDQEWEKAARGTDGRIFPWGNSFGVERANTPVRWGQLKVEGDTTPVGAFKEGISPYGMYDASGNVWEWTDAWYQPYPGNTRTNENYGEKYRVLKGGSWWDCSFYKCGISAPVFNRSFFSPKVKNSSFGFRCAKDAK